MKKFFLSILIVFAFISCQNDTREMTVSSVKGNAVVGQINLDVAVVDTMTVIAVGIVNENVGVFDQQHVFTGKQIVLSNGKQIHSIDVFLMRENNVDINSFHFAETDHRMVVKMNGAEISAVQNLTLSEKMKNL